MMTISTYAEMENMVKQTLVLWHHGPIYIEQLQWVNYAVLSKRLELKNSVIGHL